MAGGGEEHAAHSSAQDDAKDSESDGDAAEDILEESPCKRWSKRREQVKQRDVPGIDVAYLAMDNETGNEVVWNEVQFSERKNFRAQEEKINAVFDNLTQLVHTNLVKFHKYWTDAKSEKPRIIFITEYMSSGSMSLFLQRTRKSGSPLSIKAWKKWTTQILSALNYLHSCVPPITHGNLTCDTVFIQQNGLIKIGCVAPDAINHHVKTCRDNLKNMHYMAPEYEYCTEVTPAADIYSFGVCAVEIAVMGGLSGCQNGATDGPISRESIEKAVRSLEDEKQRVHSLKLLSAHKIVDSKLFDDLPADAFRVPDMEKVAAVARRETGVREMAYCQVPAFQHDLEKIVEDVRNGIYPLTAFAPLAHQPLKSTVTQPSSRTSQAQTATEGHEPSTSSLTTTSLPRAPETTDPVVCLNYGFCPLNGNNPKFRIENQVQQCYGGADATCEAIGALAYDCVCDSDDCTVNNPISFCCPSRAFACIQPPNEGYTPPGGGTTLNHWYHDPITGECRELKYQGYGQSNLILIDFVPTAPVERIVFRIDHFWWCLLSTSAGNCGTYSNRWWFNAKTGNCEEFIYSGCQGNANNFETYKECQDYCRDARSTS
ncbi:Kunitz/Bovine pancreatic trypsin inhibitor domain protein [Teladorsagia circumcincta]|uniref:Kunitz/Bovine pancreatic trypsin inhibitor domain protein n=1 Tax=Teladorsagia circumcincta TaxID=45464 RepID=A0A2G9UBM0_TELCI|nr:Kunitz/Bovine pancreatic trypsin inhibitor domain protein [Teladorsagia circumcincta]